MDGENACSLSNIVDNTFITSFKPVAAVRRSCVSEPRDSGNDIHDSKAEAILGYLLFKCGDTKASVSTKCSIDRPFSLPIRSFGHLIVCCSTFSPQLYSLPQTDYNTSKTSTTIAPVVDQQRTGASLCADIIILQTLRIREFSLSGRFSGFSICTVFDAPGAKDTGCNHIVAMIDCYLYHKCGHALVPQNAIMLLLRWSID